MNKICNNNKLSEVLRKQAEELATELPVSDSPFSLMEISKLVHELRVHQIELEMQNEELSRAQSEIEESHNRYVDLYDFAPVGYFSISQNGLIVEANLTAASMLGIERSKLLKRAFSRFVAPDFRDVFYYHRKHVLEAKCKQACELKLVKNDVTLFWVQLESTDVLDALSNSSLIRNAIIDITERKQAEEALCQSEARFRAITEKSAIGIALVNLDGRIIEANLALQNMLGYSKGELLRMESFIEITHPVDVLEYMGAAQELFKGKREDFNLEKRYIRKDGQVIWGSLIASLIRDTYGNPQNAVVMVEDITERKLLQFMLQRKKDDLEIKVQERTEELKAAHARLVQAEKLCALGKLSASIAHEYNNPIYGIKMVLEELNENIQLDEKERKSIALAINECRKISRMNCDLQDFYRPSSGLPTDLDIHQLLEEVLQLFYKRLNIKQIKLFKDFAEETPPVSVVADQIKQVFLNLIANAEAALPQSDGQLSITTRAEADRIYISFKDNGCGISKDNLGKIFEPFFTTKGAVKGTGLGLSVSYGIIKKHGGDIYVESAPNKGSTFTVELPLHSDEIKSD
jgi:PAS domain S-box-containing protein